MLNNEAITFRDQSVGVGAFNPNKQWYLNNITNPVSTLSTYDKGCGGNNFRYNWLKLKVQTPTAGLWTSVARRWGETLPIDGVVVYNNNNQQMPNGFGLWGNISTSQSAVIVPTPNNPYQYYIFTCAAEAGNGSSYSGVAYSIVDLFLNNGLGDITQKNIPLISPTAEKLITTRHCNGTDYWLICHK